VEVEFDFQRQRKRFMGIIKSAGEILHRKRLNINFWTQQVYYYLEEEHFPFSISQAFSFPNHIFNQKKINKNYFLTSKASYSLKKKNLRYHWI